MAAEKTFCVYKHTSPTNKVYIGITSQTPAHRWKHGWGYDGNNHFVDAIKKYGWNNFKHEIIAEGLTQEDAEQMEIRLIAEYDSTDRTKGYNKSSGGRINHPSAEGIERLRQLWTGHVVTEEMRIKISNAQKGKIIPIETRIKMSNAARGKKKSPEAIEKSTIAKFKPIRCVETGEVFKCMKDAQIKYGTTHIHDVCKGHRQTANGFHWEYCDGVT